MTSHEQTQRWVQRLHPYTVRLNKKPELVVEGTLARMVGLTLEAVGCRAAIGSRCNIEAKSGRIIEAEVVGFAGTRLFLMPTTEVHGLEPDCRVIPTNNHSMAKVGFGLLGRILDGSGNPIDGKGPLKTDAFISLNGSPINPLTRKPIRESLDVGVGFDRDDLGAPHAVDQ